MVWAIQFHDLHVSVLTTAFDSHSLQCSSAALAHFTSCTHWEDRFVIFLVAEIDRTRCLPAAYVAHNKSSDLFYKRILMAFHFQIRKQRHREVNSLRPITKRSQDLNAGY